MDTTHDHTETPVNNEGAERKPRIHGGHGMSPLQRLKALPEDAQDFLLQKRNDMSLARLIVEIEALHGIGGLVPPRLTEFFAWLAERRAVRRMKEDAAAFRENFGAANPDATLTEAHEAALSSLLFKAAREDNPVLLRLALGEIRKARTFGQSAEKLEIMKRRVAVLERRFEATHHPLNTETLTDEERVRRIREVFGLH